MDRPRYNIAPSQDVAALRASERGKTEVAMLRWGLVPSWAKDPAIGNRMINARAETVGDKPAFRAAFRRRRCAILADGFYEWQAVDNGPKQPWFIRPSGDGPFLMAGLWEHWDKGAEPLQSCAIITTAADRAMRTVHDRMPVVLPATALERWLLSDDRDEATEILSSAAPRWRMHRVDTTVNSPANDGPDLIRELA